MSSGMDCRPLYMMTRLNGMPIQMFAISTAISDQVGEVSQSMGWAPTALRKALTMPESLLSIHDQVEADTSSGSSHRTTTSARSSVFSRNRLAKNTASASQIADL